MDSKEFLEGYQAIYTQMRDLVMKFDKSQIEQAIQFSQNTFEFYNECLEIEKQLLGSKEKTQLL